MSRAPGTGEVALTPATPKEEGLWLLENLLPSPGINNIPTAVRVSGRLEARALHQALAATVRRHPSLRTVFAVLESRLTKAVISAEGLGGELEIEHRSVADEQLETVLHDFAARPFAFERRPLFRVGHFVGEHGDTLCVVAHHLVFDAVSAGVFLRELGASYDALRAGDAPAAQRAEEVDELGAATPSEASVAYWRDALRGLDPHAMALACGKREIAAPRLAGGRIFHDLSPEVIQVVRRLQRELRAPESVVLLAAYYLLLATHGAGPDLVVGSPVNMRRGSAPTIGYHVNTLALRVRLDLLRDVRELVTATRKASFDGFARADVAVDVLLPDLPRAGASWRTTLFRHMFNYLPETESTSFRIGGDDAITVSVENGYSKFDFELFVASSKTGIRIRAVYCADLLSGDDARRLLSRYETLLGRLGADPSRPLGEVSCWSAEDAAVVDAVNQPAPALPTASVLEQIAARVAASPDTVAVEDDARKVTYAELWRAALATRDLLERGVAGALGEVVAIAGPRGPGLVAAVLGVWLSSAAYVALAVEAGAEETADVMAGSGARVVLALAGAAVPDDPRFAVVRLPPLDALVGHEAQAPGALPAGGRQAAAIMTTRDASGRRVMTSLDHDGLGATLAHFVDALGVADAQATLWLAPLSSCMSAVELLLPLTSGGRLVVAPDAARSDGALLRQLIDQRQPGVVQATPATWRRVLDQVGDRLSGRRVLCSGGPLAPALARELLATGCTLHAAHLPQDGALYVASGRITAAGPATIHPMPRTRLSIVDAGGRVLPPGVTGELRVTGLAIPRSSSRPDEPLIDDASHGRAYRTGDAARWTGDGTLEIIGDLSRRLVVRDVVVDLGEIEAALRRHPDVYAAAVIAVDPGTPGTPGTGDGVVVAFVEAAERPALVTLLEAHVRSELASSALPGKIVVTSALPITADARVDYAALQRRVTESRTTAIGEAWSHDSDDALLDKLVALWGDFLGQTDLTPDTHFFLHGGHSMLAARLAQQVRSVTGVRVRLADVFANPTPRGLAAHLRGQAAHKETTEHRS